MPRLQLASYDLSDTFQDSSGNVYSYHSGQDLKVWIRPAPDEPKDLSRNNLSCEYDDDPPISDATIGSKSYPVIGDQASSPGVIEVSNSTGDLSFTSLPSAGTPTTSSDRPFSISMWVKVDSPHASGTGYIAWKPSLSYGEYGLIIATDDSLRFQLYDDDNDASQFVLTTGEIPLGQWNHIVVTYDGRGGTGAATVTAALGLKIYMNGSDYSGSRTYAGSYKGMQPNWGADLVIRNFAPANSAVFKGEIAEIALWNRELPEVDILTIYNATRNGAYDLFTGYLNNPVRTIVRSRDNATGSYPSVLRTTGFKQSTPDPFDDNRTVVFHTIKKFRKLGANRQAVFTDPLMDVHYPVMLTKVDHDKYYRNWVSTPNTSGSIIASGSVGPFISLQGLEPSINQHRDFTPFNESRVYIDPGSTFYMTGTKRTTYPGFTSPLEDKVQIVIPLPNVSDKICSRWNSDFGGDVGVGTNFIEPGVTDSTDVEVTPTSQYSGFSYYNWINGRWEDIGLYDPATGIARKTHMFYLAAEKRQGSTYLYPEFLPYASDGKHKQPWHIQPPSYQFKMSHHTMYMTRTYNDLIMTGAYGKIGAPTIAAAAPQHPRYHATSSQALSLSSYIKHPFLLEKAVIEIPVIVRRKNGASYPPGGSYKVDGGDRDIDNYTFFMYRQQRRPSFKINMPTSPSDQQNYIERDSAADVSGSTRFLVMSASAAFYNSPSIRSSALQSEISSLGLPHTPSFEYDFNLEVDSDSIPSEGAEAAFTGSIRLEFIPAVANRGDWGGSRFAIRSGTVPGEATKFPSTSWQPISAYTSAVIQDFWPGGTTDTSQMQLHSSSWAYMQAAGEWRVAGPIPTTNDAGPYSLSPFEARWGNLIQVTQHSTENTDPEIIISEPGANRPFTGRAGFSTDERSTGSLGYYPETGAGAGDNFPRTGYICRGIKVDQISPNTPSPYLLLPEDEIVIGIDASISSTMVSGTQDQLGFDKSNHDMTHAAGKTRCNALNIMSGSFMKIMAGEAKLTLFGSLIKEDKEHMSSLDQNLTSDAIHHDIHQVGPLDQYMIGSAKDYRGTYIDRYITGSMSVRGRPLADGRAGTRGVSMLFSSEDDIVPNFKGPVSRLSRGGLNYLTSQNLSGSLLRGVKLVDKSERFYDTLLPDYVEYASLHNVDSDGDKTALGVFYVSNNLSRGVTKVNRQGHTVIYAFSSMWEGLWGPPVIEDTGQDPYTAQPTLRSYDDGRILRYRSGRELPYATNPTRMSSDRFISIGARYDDAIWEAPKSSHSVYIFADSRRDNRLVNALFYEVGWKFRWLQQNHPAAAKSNQLVTGSKAFGQCSLGDSTCRGYMYGIMSTTPLNSSAVFRPDHFGQFRDMLEQRRDGTFWRSPWRRTPSGRLTRVRGRKSDPAVEVQFVNMEDGMTLVDPYSTNCSNLSQAATSSIPYVDGEIKNSIPGSGGAIVSFVLAT